MASSYIPTTDSGYNDWLYNFAALITATPSAFGLVSGDAVIIQAQADAYGVALLAATDPTTRTAVTISAKDAAKSASLAIVRPYAVGISLDPSVTNDDKTAVGVTVRKVIPSPVPAPVAVPLVSFVSGAPMMAILKVVNSDTPTSKAKPFGSIGIEIWQSVGTVPATDPAQLGFVGSFTKIPLTLAYDAGQRGKIASVAARFVTRGGIGGQAKTGPWSDVTNFFVP